MGIFHTVGSSGGQLLVVAKTGYGASLGFSSAVRTAPAVLPGTVPASLALSSPVFPAFIALIETGERAEHYGARFIPRQW